MYYAIGVSVSSLHRESNNLKEKKERERKGKKGHAVRHNKYFLP